MLQQTQVSRVLSKYDAFLGQFPNAVALANASTTEVLSLWSGLGYNRRAISLQRCARAIVNEYDGKLPRDYSLLRVLPGIGEYTARAILVFAFEEPFAVLDTNVGRILTRLLVGEPVKSRSRLQEIADEMVIGADPWAWNQALLDLGATVCQKRVSRCMICPLYDHCSWRGQGQDPARTTATSGRPQSRFEGSDRQLRGQIVRVLLKGTISQEHLCDELAAADRKQVEAVMQRLVDEGMIHRSGKRIALC